LALPVNTGLMSLPSSRSVFEIEVICMLSRVHRHHVEMTDEGVSNITSKCLALRSPWR
jgi:hypothetical protein